MGKRTSLENKLLAAYLSGYQAGMNAMKKRAGGSDIKTDKPWKECEYFTEEQGYMAKYGGCCLGTKEIDSCQQEHCDHIRLKKKEK